MLVHRRSLPRNLSGFPNNFPLPIYTPGWREALWELSVLHKNTTQCPRPGLEPGPLDPELSALTMRWPCHIYIVTIYSCAKHFVIVYLSLMINKWVQIWFGFCSLQVKWTFSLLQHCTFHKVFLQMLASSYLKQLHFFFLMLQLFLKFFISFTV